MGASCLWSFDLVSALLLPSAALPLSVDIFLLSGLLILEIVVSRVVTMCFSVRRSRSSVDFIAFVRALPDCARLCGGRSVPAKGELGPDFWYVLDSNWVLVVSWVLMRGTRADVFSPADEPLCLLLSVWDGYLFEADIIMNYI